MQCSHFLSIHAATNSSNNGKLSDFDFREFAFVDFKELLICYPESHDFSAVLIFMVHFGLSMQNL